MSDDLTASFIAQDKEDETLQEAIERAFFSNEQSEATPAPIAAQEPTSSVADPDDDEPVKDEVPSWARDIKDTIQAIERKSIYQQHQQPQPNGYEQQHQYAPQPKQQQADRQPNRMLTDLDGEEFAQRMEHLERYQKSMIQGFAVQESQSFAQAEAMLKQRYPDFDEVIPTEQRQRALHGALQAGRFGNDWSTNMANAYKLFAFDKHFSQKDEVANKREQKKDEQRKQAAQIPPAGANYQAPAPKLEPGKRGYRDADRAFLEQLRAGI